MFSGSVKGIDSFVKELSVAIFFVAFLLTEVK
jgi:hypothetical protein